jgi:hypothetical protein
MYSENKKELTSEFMAEVLFKDVDEKRPIFGIVNMANRQKMVIEIPVGIPESLWGGIKKGDLIFLKVKVNGAGVIQASSCQKIYTDKVMDVLGD